MTKRNTRFPFLAFFLAIIASTGMAGNMEPAFHDNGDSHRMACHHIFRHTAADTILASEQTPQQFVNTRPNLLERAESMLPFYHKVMDLDKRIRIVQIGDSHVAGKYFPNAVRDVLNSKLGRTSDDSTRISYDIVAQNGATMGGFLTAEKIGEIAEKDPDLIIISFGTNECHGMRYNEQTHLLYLEQAFCALQAACPNASFLFTTPPGAYLRRRPNPMSSRCSSLLEQFASDKNVALWNLYEIAGGRRALRNYISLRMLRRDRVHFTAQGYQLQGRLLGEAIVNSLPKT